MHQRHDGALIPVHESYNLGLFPPYQEPIRYHNCSYCGLTFESEYQVREHQYFYHTQGTSTHTSGHVTWYIPASQEGPLPPTENFQPTSLNMCDLCDLTFCSTELLRNHTENHHTGHFSRHEVHCNKCEYTFENIVHLNVHLKQFHSSDIDHAIPRVPRVDSTDSMSDKTDLDICDSVLEVAIPQVDGNDSISDISEYSGISPTTTSVQSLVSPPMQLPSTSLPVSAPENIQYQYNINPMNQAKRLLENSVRPPLEIRYSNPQTIRGCQHPTSVSVDCNTGVYMSAIKPVLDNIKEGWRTVVSSVTIVCHDISDRTEMSGRKVCTKLVLHLIEQQAESVPCKVVLHFYHTSSTLHAQGSTILSSGVSAPVWLVKEFLEPLAISHINQNSNEISAINNDIRESSKHDCAKCKTKIKSTATHAKDQQLPCSKCGLLYHKRCTDRKRTTGNWKRMPWFCEPCIKAYSYLTNLNLNSTTATPSPEPVAPAITGDQALEIDDTIDTIENLAPTTIPNPGTIVSLPPAADNNPSLSTATQPTQPMGAGETVRFPMSNTRQRSSNINMKDPEKEFLDTAVKACRSTITQQESELKRLKENIDIRNKRISQLENQVSEAASHIADRTLPHSQRTNDNSTNHRVEEALQLILSKLEQNSNSPSILINNSQNGVAAKPQQTNQYSQTDGSCHCCDLCTLSEVIGSNLENHTSSHHRQDAESEMYSCNVCNELFNSQATLETHGMSHSSTAASEFSHTCTDCGRKFWSVQHLLEHSESEHAVNFLSCTDCNYKCVSRTHLKDHFETCHTDESCKTAPRKTL